MNASQQPPTLSYAYPPGMVLGPQGSSSSCSCFPLSRWARSQNVSQCSGASLLLSTLSGPSAVTTNPRCESRLQQSLQKPCPLPLELDCFQSPGTTDLDEPFPRRLRPAVTTVRAHWNDGVSR
ncbi:hypothetical protein BDV23DRAFT_129874 [Aspergillus alliaceus]|uniref:Uncharacterized protein n=1 Tax=Petromyces alliaceus TaxID=209559 RepID=A0A5N7BZJ8_PETAA|nr:hypothetical protein BDV23DRAFT_129874 [Aspergillus alliaceus]